MRVVRKTMVGDLDTVMAIYDCARRRMRESGNTAQWVNGYPSREILMADVEAGCSYVIADGGKIAGVFTFVVGVEPTYAKIEGAWPDNDAYGTIHRIAAADGEKGIADAALVYCMGREINIRIDTHADNSPMLGWIAKRGFSYCGIIHVEDGTPRMAFQLNGSTPHDKHCTKSCNTL